MIDGFEDGDIDEYTGDTDPFAASTTNPFDSDRSLECTTTSAGSKRIFHTDVAWSPTDETTLQCWINRSHSASLLFGGQSHEDHYYAQLRDYNETDAILELARAENGFNSIELEILGIDRTNYDWLRMVVDWQPDGAMTATLYDQSAIEIGRVTGTDTVYGAGGIGIGAYIGTSDATTSFYDTIETVAHDRSDVGGRDALTGTSDPHTAVTTTFDPHTSLGGEL